jgi:hypothetical protein
MDQARCLRLFPVSANEASSMKIADRSNSQRAAASTTLAQMPC